jgi:hypothetical protein
MRQVTTGVDWIWLSSRKSVLFQKLTGSAIQEISPLSRNPQVHSRVQKIPPQISGPRRYAEFKLTCEGLSTARDCLFQHSPHLRIVWFFRSLRKFHPREPVKTNPVTTGASRNLWWLQIAVPDLYFCNKQRSSYTGPDREIWRF